MPDLKQKGLSLLASVTAVDVNTTDKTTLYTVPPGKSCVVTSVVGRLASISLTTAHFAFGFNANGNDVVTDTAASALDGATKYQAFNAISGAVRGAAGDVFGIKCPTAQGVAATATFDVFGYLY